MNPNKVPAFPFSVHNPTEYVFEVMGNPLGQGTTYFPGMSLRQYVAVHSPIDLVSANESLHQTATSGKPDDNGVFPMRLVIAEAARLTVMYTDLLLAELAKDQGTAEVAQSLSDKDNA